VESPDSEALVSELDKLNSSLKSEADIILYQHGLWEALARHGRPVVMGSYVMDTMTWADLDLYLTCDAPDAGEFFDLGREILSRLQPVRLDYHNNLSSHWPQFPRGLYWGVRTSHGLPRPWKLDIWRLDPTVAQERLESQAALQSRITPECREAILQIKSHFCSHPRYGMGFSGMDIYTAVLDRGMRSPTQFEEVLREKGIE